MKKNTFTFVVGKPIGKCPCCTEEVKDNQLFVVKEEQTYHLSCYNLKKSKEQEDNE